MVHDNNDTTLTVGYFYCWQAGDELPELETDPSVETSESADVGLLTALAELEPGEIERRFAIGNRAYVAVAGDQVCGYGWSAWKLAEIGELGITFNLPGDERYLWDFVTLPDWRGQGVYPHMLQSIIRAESGQARRFWIGHDLSNTASRRGILKAGFTTIGEVVLAQSGPQFAVYSSGEIADAAAKLLGLQVRHTEPHEGAGN